ncbi:MAG: GNAT family protein [Candidatus Lokiarchaeota archaeon]
MVEDKEKNIKDEEEDIISPFLEGEEIDLVPNNLEHIKLYAKWMNDEQVRHFARNPVPHTIEEIKKWFEPSEERFTEHISFEVWHKKDKKPIGTGGFSHINWINRNANIFLSIGESEYWSKGIGTEATKLLVKYGFEELNLHKIYAGIYEPNKGSWSVAEKVGFIQEATLREEIYVDGKYEDVRKYYLIKNEWFNKDK